MQRGNDTGSATPQVTLGTGNSFGAEEVPSFESVEISFGDGELTNTVNHKRRQWSLYDEPGNWYISRSSRRRTLGSRSHSGTRRA